MDQNPPQNTGQVTAPQPPTTSTPEHYHYSFLGTSKTERRRNLIFLVVLVLVLTALGIVNLTYKPAWYRQENDVVGLSSFLQEAFDESGATTTASISPGTMPNELDICTNSCTHQWDIFDLEYYTNKEITVHPYVAGLRVPNITTAYIVNNANCNRKNNGLGAYGVTADGNPAQSILYAVTNNNNQIAFHCDNVFDPNPPYPQPQ